MDLFVETGTRVTNLNPAIAAKLSVGQTIVLCGLPGGGAAAGFHPKGETAEQLQTHADQRRSSRSDTLEDAPGQ